MDCAGRIRPDRAGPARRRPGPCLMSASDLCAGRVVHRRCGRPRAGCATASSGCVSTSAGSTGSPRSSRVFSQNRFTHGAFLALAMATATTRRGACRWNAPARRLPTLPCAEHRRRPQPVLHWPDRRCLDFRRTGRAASRRPGAAARPAGRDRPRQRTGRHEPRHVRLVGADRRALALHRAGQARARHAFVEA